MLPFGDIWQVHIIGKKKLPLIVLLSQMSLSSFGIFVLCHAVFSISSCQGLLFNEHQIATQNYPILTTTVSVPAVSSGRFQNSVGLWYFLLYRFCLDNVNPPNEAIVLLSEPIVLPGSLPFSCRDVSLMNICVSVMLSTRVLSHPHPLPTPHHHLFFFLIKAFTFKFMGWDAIWIHTGWNWKKQYIYLSQNVILHETVV